MRGEVGLGRGFDAIAAASLNKQQNKHVARVAVEEAKKLFAAAEHGLKSRDQRIGA